MKRSLLVKIAITLLLSLSSLGVVGGSFLLKKALSNSGEPELITDTSSYQQIREQLGNNSYLIKHFPRYIPADAQGVKIAYSPATATSNSFLQVRFKQPAQKIQKALADYQKLAKYKYYGGNTNDHANLPNGVPTTFFYTSGTNVESFPPSYQVLVLNAQNRGTSGFNWSHGDSYGVAIDKSAAEIVYWFEKW